MENYYNGTTHIFYSDNSDEVVIKAGQGQTLTIPGYQKGDLIAGAGLSRTDNTMSAKVDGSTIGTNELSGALEVKDSGITNAKLFYKTINILPQEGLAGGGNASLGSSVSLKVLTDNSTIEVSGITNKIQLKDSTNYVKTGGDQNIAGNKVFEKVSFSDLDSNTISLKCPDNITSNYTLTLPTTSGTTGQVLTTDGTGTLSWSSGGAGGASGLDTYVQFNDGGAMGSDSSFVYKKSATELSAPITVSNNFKSKISTDTLGYNELANKQALTQYTTGEFYNTGHAVAITNRNSASGSKTRILAGAPVVNYGGSSNGGAITWDNVSDAVFGSPTPYQVSTFCDDIGGQSVDISESGDNFCYSRNGMNSVIYVYKWNGSSYNTQRTISGHGFNSCKITDGGYVLVSNQSNNLSVYYYTTGPNWVLQQQILNGAVSIFEIQGSNLWYYSGTSIYKWTLSGGVWTQTSSFVVDPSPNSMSISGNVILLHYGSYVKIYEDEILTATLNQGGITLACTNGTYVFFVAFDKIYIAHKVSGVWTLSTNYTQSADVSAIACNENRLVIGRKTVDTYGRIDVYNIDPYTSQIVNCNEMKTLSKDLFINSNYGQVRITATSRVELMGSEIGIYGNTGITGELYTTGAISTPSTITSTGNITTAGAFIGISNTSRRAYYYRTSIQTLGAKYVPVLFDVAQSEITGLYRSTANLPYYTGTFTNTSNAHMVLLVVYNNRWKYLSESVAYTYISVNQVSSGSPVSCQPVNKPWLALSTYNSNISAGSCSCILDLAPNEYFTLISDCGVGSTFGPQNSTYYWDQCSLEIFHLL